MNTIIVRWGVDIALAVSFILCFITGVIKYTYLMALLGLTSLVYPAAILTDLHDWTGLALGFLVAIHLILNRRWIIATTRKILSGKTEEP